MWMKNEWTRKRWGERSGTEHQVSREEHLRTPYRMLMLILSTVFLTWIHNSSFHVVHILYVVLQSLNVEQMKQKQKRKKVPYRVMVGYIFSRFGYPCTNVCRLMIIISYECAYTTMNNKSFDIFRACKYITKNSLFFAKFTRDVPIRKLYVPIAEY